MRADWMQLLLALITGGGLSLMGQALRSGISSVRRARQYRETEIERWRRQAAQWETVARRARMVAIDHGAALHDLPLGPGEDPMRSMGGEQP